MACRRIVGIAKILTNDGMEPEEITNIEIYRSKFILKRHVFVIARDQRQYRKYAGYAPCSWC